MFSDGDDTASKSRLRTVTNRARADNVMVYAIGFASQHVNDDDEEVRAGPDPGLKKLAAETGGGYFRSPHAFQGPFLYLHACVEGAA